MASLVAQSALILLREGLEAILVLAALAALLRRAAPGQLRGLYIGAWLGIAASLLAAFAYFAWHDGVHDDRVEGITCLLAAALMLATGGWLYRRADPRAWSAALQAQAERALASPRTALALGGIGFLAVFREGAETALFLAALGAEGGVAPILLGLALGAAGCAVLWWAIARAALRLPLRPVFLATSVFLLVMAVRLVGAAVQEFQEQALLAFDPVAVPDALVELGLSPSLVGLAAQAAILLLAMAVVLWPRAGGGARIAAAE